MLNNTESLQDLLNNRASCNTTGSCLYKEKYKFQNPLFQNHKHVKAVQTHLGYLESKFIHNIVVFTGEAEFKTDVPDNVLFLEELIPAIELYNDSALSIDRVQYCVARLDKMRLELTQETDNEHQASLSKKRGQVFSKKT